MLEQNIGLTHKDRREDFASLGLRLYGLEASSLYVGRPLCQGFKAAAENAIKTSSVQPMTQAQCLEHHYRFQQPGRLHVGLSADIRGCCSFYRYRQLDIIYV